MSVSDKIIQVSGVVVTNETDRLEIMRQAGRRVNMAGGRYSDALRAELATYARDRYTYMHQTVVSANETARLLGYIR